MGRYVAVEEAGYGWPAHERPREWRVFYEPASKPAASVPGGSRGAAPPHPDDPAAPPTGGPGASPPASPVDIEAVVLGLEALGDRTRLAIVRSLRAHGEMFSGEVAERLGVHLSTAPRHLAQLEAAQLVRVRRDGKLKLYMVDPGKIQAIASFLQRQFD